MTNPNVVKLDAYEQQVAVLIGTLRNTDNDGTTERGVAEEPAKRLARDIMGCAGEIAAAKRLNLYWSGMARKQVDVGFSLEVRAIDNPGLRLTARQRDADESVLVLVHVRADYSCEVMGWESVSEIRKRGKFMESARGGKPYHLLDARDLRSVEDLVGILVTRSFAELRIPGADD